MISTPLDELFSDYAGDVPGASAIVLRNGVVQLAAAFGLADVENHTPATPTTNYRLASVSKQFTAMAIMQLKESGKLRYDQDIRDFIPELPRNPSGKVLKRELRKPFWEGRERQVN